ncbi:ATP-binding protein [Vibrio sp. Vb2110]|nr:MULTISPECIES: ATP-binding protein [unclassified Vibrio]EGR0712970.1 ATP-binding protein [Vibrio alginolyticus]MDW1848354.1 ATP-binding protein [Vibrio sp. Vb2130]MDW1882470.1 ATP-binding protein [Vibrio sp. Vb2110]MDW2040501.1 ATP-binding protein [Vibrio sp. 2130-1]MDW2137493.1 ATP-binding protein [Vibrio sp. 2128(2023)]
MASSTQIKALMQSHIDKDDDRFLSVALQVAAHEARNGHGKLAQELKGLVEKAKKNSVKNLPVSIATGVKDTSGLLVTTHPSLRFADLIVSSSVKGRLERLVKEQKHLTTLKNHGLSPRRKLLLAGKPGTGKTFTASVLAGELNFPLFEVRLDAVITKYLGESSAKLRQIFDTIREVRGVYFFDEFDALGSHRGSGNDVGEARRILNSFLQMIEQDDSNSVIVCATNHIEALDHALFRRFDDVIKYELPSEDEIIKLFRTRLQPYVAKNFSWKRLPAIAEGLSNAEITLAANDAIKEMLIHDYNSITTTMLQQAIEDRKSISQHFME